MLRNAQWIKSPENKKEACYEFYTEFNSANEILSATLNITAMGMYCAFINGQRIGNEYFTPYWTEYSKRLQYQDYDISDLIKNNNVLKVVCAEGWAVGCIKAGAEHRNHYAKNISLRFSLKIQYTDGTSREIISDENIIVRTSSILQSSIYDGETVDRTAKSIILGNAVIDRSVKTNVIPQEGEKVVRQEILKPVSCLITPKGEKVIDFGQNLVGFVEINISGKRNDRIVISHAEILDKYGNFYVDNLRSAKQKNTYVLSGVGEETFSPTFSWQGFRYIRLDEYPFEHIDLNCFNAVVIHSDIRRTGDFICGNKKINQLYHNIIWGQKGNFIDVPTDCPQRDERLGWTGDAQVFVKTAAINFDVERFFGKWLADLSAGQYKDGGVFWQVPTNNCYYPENVSSGWGDAATICPWEIYLAYGNKNILETQYDSMRKWVEYIRNWGNEEYLWLGGKQFGDWLALDNEDGSYKGATSFDYISTSFYAYSTSLLIKAGKVLSKDMTEYEKLYENILKAFEQKFVRDGMPVEKTQTAYALALYFNLCPNKPKIADGLAEMVKSNGNKLTTGFVGTPYILHALSQNGYADVAFDLLFQEEFPSWLYSVNQGATTIWEHWDGIKPDGSLWSSDMNSFNHYAYGSVFDWIFGVAAGISVLEDGAGYRHIQLKPHIDKRFGFLKAGIDSRSGYLSSYWYYKDNDVFFEFDIPEKTIAELVLPDGRVETLSGGKYVYSMIGGLN